QPSLAQSECASHALPAAQRGPASGPPQSTSVSPPFFTPSSNVGAAHMLVTGSQTLLAHSAPSVQPLPTSDGGAHTPFSQVSLSQSAGTVHVLPSPHLGADEPPQSTSVSSPSFVPSATFGSSSSGTSGAAGSLEQAASETAAAVRAAPSQAISRVGARTIHQGITRRPLDNSAAARANVSHAPIRPGAPGRSGPLQIGLRIRAAR